jgi:hypothetical protein
MTIRLSPEEFARRIRIVSELRDLCLSLRRAAREGVRNPQSPSRADVLPPGEPAPDRVNGPFVPPAD